MLSFTANKKFPLADRCLVCLYSDSDSERKLIRLRLVSDLFLIELKLNLFQAQAPDENLRWTPANINHLLSHQTLDFTRIYQMSSILLGPHAAMHVGMEFEGSEGGNLSVDHARQNASVIVRRNIEQMLSMVCTKKYVM